MKKLCMSTLVVAVSALGVGITYASDLPMPAAPMIIQPIFTWTGARIGGFAGYALSLTKVKNDATNPVYKNTNGWLGGALIGYDYQIGPFVIGALTDFAGSQLQGRVQSFSAASLNDSKININYVGTIRVRAGYAVDRALVYGTAGWVYMNIKGTFPMFPSIAGAGPAYKSTVWGWAVGGGIEYAVTDHVIANLEYLYLAPSKVTFASGYSSFNNGAGFQIKERTSVVRAGIAYKF